MKNLRKINTAVSALLIILVMAHGIIGSFKLLGIGTHAGTVFAWAAVVLLALHTVIGVVLTVQTVKNEKNSGGKLYLRQNSAFWIRRLTGLSILCTLYFHLGMFGMEANSGYVLMPFTTAKFIAMLTLVFSVFIHIFASIRSLFVGAGIFASKEKRENIAVFLSVILVFISGSLVLYYISWCI